MLRSLREEKREKYLLEIFFAWSLVKLRFAISNLALGNQSTLINEKMPHLIRNLIRLFVAFVAIFICLQPYNWFCQITQSCRPFYFSYYFPKREGDDLKLVFEVTNYNRDLLVSLDQANLDTKTNRKNLVTYRVENKSKKLIKFRPTLITEPEEAQKYLIRYQCPCSHTFKIKGKEVIEFQLEFAVDDEIFERDDRIAEKPIKIRYKF